MTMRKQKARERLPNMPLPTRNQTGEHAPSFIGEMQPSVVWSQSAAYLPVSAKLSNMQKSLSAKTVIAFATVPVLLLWSVKESRFAGNTNCRTVQDMSGRHRS